MSRAYCLTCNEDVHETPGGTCPLGHPVAADGYGPEPWVGFAGDGETDVAGVRMQHLGANGRPREHASVGQHLNGTPHVNGAANGSSNGHASSNGHSLLPPSSVPFPPVSRPANGSDRPAFDLASDDLTSLLADALRDNAPGEQAPPPAEPSPAPVDQFQSPAPAHHPAPPTPAGSAEDDADWGELANLAAELHLDESVATDDGPRAPAPPAPEPERATHPDETPAPQPVAPAHEAPEGELSASSIDDLLAELTGGTPDPAPPVAEVPRPPEPLTADNVTSWDVPSPPATDDIAAWDTPPPPPATPAPPARPVAPPPSVAPPPPPAPPVDATDLWDAPAPSDGVGSAPAADPADIWAEAELAADQESTPAPVVDLSNFTARGKRVGDTGSAPSARKKKRGRKR